MEAEILGLVGMFMSGEEFLGALKELHLDKDLVTSDSICNVYRKGDLYTTLVVIEKKGESRSYAFNLGGGAILNADPITGVHKTTMDELLRKSQVVAIQRWT